MKTCTICKESKPKTEEYFYKNGPHFKSECKECRKIWRKNHYKNTQDRSIEYSRVYRKNNRDKIKEGQTATYFGAVKRKYKLTKEEYLTMWNEQNGLCKICKTPFNNNKNPSVDHCHDTGKVRGLLCHKCNTGLGMFNDNPDLVLLACDYLLDAKEIDNTKSIYED